MHKNILRHIRNTLVLVAFLTQVEAQTPIPAPILSSQDIESYKVLDDTPDCQHALKDIQGIENIEFEKRVLFVHTIKAFQKINKEKYLLEAYAQILKAGKQEFLLMEFVINSQNAKQTYGKLAFDSKIKLTFLNDDYTYLQNIEQDKGKLNRKEQQTIYKAVYPIDKSKTKLLRKNYIKKIGVIWEEGFQEYNVINIDLISNQLTCLNNL